MRRLVFPLGLVALIAPPAAAEDADTAAIGVGASTTLGGSSGIHVRKLLIPELEAMLTVGVALDSSTVEVGGMDQENRITVLDAGLHAGYRLREDARVALWAVGGVDVQYYEDQVDDSADSASDLLLGAGLRVEVTPTERISLFAQAGLVFDLLAEEELEGGMVVVGDSGVAVGLGADLAGAAGFTIWFR
jgi:hypothetical protein